MLGGHLGRGGGGAESAPLLTSFMRVKYCCFLISSNFFQLIMVETHNKICFHHSIIKIVHSIAVLKTQLK